VLAALLFILVGAASATARRADRRPGQPPTRATARLSRATSTCGSRRQRPTSCADSSRPSTRCRRSCSASGGAGADAPARGLAEMARQSRTKSRIPDTDPAVAEHLRGCTPTAEGRSSRCSRGAWTRSCRRCASCGRSRRSSRATPRRPPRGSRRPRSPTWSRGGRPLPDGAGDRIAFSVDVPRRCRRCRSTGRWWAGADQRDRQRPPRDAGGGSLSIRRAARGDGVELEVADTGVGMDEEALARLFEPYFSTKAVGPASPVDCAAERRAERGTIRVASERNVGRSDDHSSGGPVAGAAPRPEGEAPPPAAPAEARDGEPDERGSRYP